MTFAQRHPTIFFFLAANVITYLVGGLAFLVLRTIQESLGTNLPWTNDIVLRFGPTLAGVLTTALIAGKKGLNNLFRRCVRWRFALPLYLGAVFIQPVIYLAVLFLRGYGSEVQSAGLATAIGVFAAQLLLNIFPGGGSSEEVGWRGFMLPQLCKHHSPLVASLIVGIAWFAWHIPAFIFLGKGESDPVLPLAVIMLPFSIIFTWAYFRAKESILLAILLHGAINASDYSLEKLLPGVANSTGFQRNLDDWSLVAFWFVFALIVVAKWGFSLGKAPLTENSAKPSKVIEPYPN